MIRGLYASASSLNALLRRQESLSQNLANLNTPGFKQELTLLQDAVDSDLIQVPGEETGTEVGPLPSGVDGTEMIVDYSQGPLAATGRPLDLAILGEGFFRIQTPDGERLTRDGTFHRDSNGHLVTADGNFLLGPNGPIQIGEGVPSIMEDGTIYLPGTTQPVGRIALARVADPTALVREQHNLLNSNGAVVQPVAAGAGSIRQGAIEQANVDVSGTMVSMMLALRSYEAAQRSIRMQDETLQRTLEIGRLG